MSNHLLSNLIILRFDDMTNSDTRQTKYILGIDPGTTQSGYAVFNAKNNVPVASGKIDNQDILNLIFDMSIISPQDVTVVIERFAPQSNIGMTTVTSIHWAGRFYECAVEKNFPVYRIYRRDIKKHLLGKFDKSKGSADSQIRKELVKRFAKFDFKNGKGNKDNPDTLYGFSHSDTYSALAVIVAYLDGVKRE